MLQQTEKLVQRNAIRILKLNINKLKFKNMNKKIIVNFNNTAK